MRSCPPSRTTRWRVSMPLARRTHRAILVILTLLLLTSGSPLTLLAADAVAPTQRATRSTPALAAAEGAVSVEAPDPTVTPASGPSLALTWSADAATVGVPLTLAIHARDATGQPASRDGAILLDVPD